MGFLSNLISETRSSSIVSGIRNPPEILVNMLGGLPTKSGAQVNEETVLGLTAVWLAVRLLASLEASLPLITYKKLKPRGKERASDHYLYKMLHDQPNSELTSFDYRFVSAAHKFIWGAAISEIEFDSKGYPIALWPIPPRRVEPKRTVNKELVYEVNVDNKIYTLRKEQVVCVRFFPMDTDGWLSPISVHRETFGASLAVKEFGARTFGQGTNPSGILTGLKFKQGANEESLLKKVKEAYEGLSNSHRLMLLEEGVKFERIGIPPQDAQYLETQKFHISEASRIWNIPANLLHEHEKNTTWGSGIEETNIGFVAFSLRPSLVQIEQELNKKVIYEDDMFVEFLIDGLLRGKLNERYEGYKTGLNNGFLCPDDVREFENMNPLPNGLGQVFMVPLNMQSIEFAREKPDKSKQNTNTNTENDNKEKEQGE